MSISDEARNRARQAYEQRLADKGCRKVTLRLSKTASEQLTLLSKKHGSPSAAIEHLLTTTDN